ncbi:MAG: hypothetical protein K8F25_05150 [Fimbriimonadaceae bacterium]|nr:hypothetical protein [Alphaproteobacteria bacterium]
MQTIRKYAYLVVTGLVAALVLINTLTRILSQTADSVLSNAGSIAGEHTQFGYFLLNFIIVLIAIAVMKHALAGIPNIFRERFQNLKRRFMFLLVLGLVASMFVIF